MRFLAPNPDKGRVEILLLCYSPVWIIAVAAVMLSGVLAAWQEAQHLALGLAMALPLWVMPLFLPAGPARHFHRFNVLVFLLSFIQCYFGAKLFFEQFGMQYHFHVTRIVNGTPLFLYFMTVAYFSTYFVGLQVGWRAFNSAFPSAPAPLRLLVRALLSYVVAFAETATMATPILGQYFSYRDPRWVMLYGSVCYGTIFFVTLPQFARMDEDKTSEGSPRSLVGYGLAANMLILVVYEGWAWLIEAYRASAHVGK